MPLSSCLPPARGFRSSSRRSGSGSSLRHHRTVRTISCGPRSVAVPSSPSAPASAPSSPTAAPAWSEPAVAPAASRARAAASVPRQPPRQRPLHQNRPSVPRQRRRHASCSRPPLPSAASTGTFCNPPPRSGQPPRQQCEHLRRPLRLCPGPGLQGHTATPLQHPPASSLRPGFRAIPPAPRNLRQDRVRQQRPQNPNIPNPRPVSRAAERTAARPPTLNPPRSGRPRL